MEHERVLFYEDAERLCAPGEVCWGCSDPEVGVWVPASFCAVAAATFPADESGWNVDGGVGTFTPEDAPSVWDEEPFDPMDRWDAFDPDACWRGARAA